MNKQTKKRIDNIIAQGIKNGTKPNLISKLISKVLSEEGYCKFNFSFGDAIKPFKRNAESVPHHDMYDACIAAIYSRGAKLMFMDDLAAENSDPDGVKRDDTYNFMKDCYSKKSKSELETKIKKQNKTIKRLRKRCEELLGVEEIVEEKKKKKEPLFNVYKDGCLVDIVGNTNLMLKNTKDIIPFLDNSVNEFKYDFIQHLPLNASLDLGKVKVTRIR
jgi:hypothetical protein